MEILTVVILTENGEIGSLIPYTDAQAAIEDYRAAVQSEGSRAILFYTEAAGEPGERRIYLEGVTPL